MSQQCVVGTVAHSHYDLYELDGTTPRAGAAGDVETTLVRDSAVSAEVVTVAAIAGGGYESRFTPLHAGTYTLTSRDTLRGVDYVETFQVNLNSIDDVADDVATVAGQVEAVAVGVANVADDVAEVAEGVADVAVAVAGVAAEIAALTTHDALMSVVDVDARTALDHVLEREVGTTVGGQHVGDVQEAVDPTTERHERGADAGLDVDDLSLVDVA